MYYLEENLVMLPVEKEAKRLHHEEIMNGTFNTLQTLTKQEAQTVVDGYVKQAITRLSTLN